MIICPTCMAENRAQARFCLSCGTALLAEAPAVVPQVPASPAPTDADAQEEETPADPALSPASAQPDTLVVTEPPAGSEPGSTQVMEDVASESSTLLPPAAEEDDAVQAAHALQEAATAEGMSEPLSDLTTDPSSALPVQQPAPEPLPEGTLIAGRFVIAKLIEEGSLGRIYAASDPGACNQCGATIEPGDQFCGACGFELTGPAAVRLQESTEAPDPATQAVEHDNRWYAVLAAQTQAPAAEPSRPQTGWRFQVGQVSDPGKIRDLDEDSVFAFTLSGIYESQIAPTVGLYIVADGIGGHQGGEVASKLAVQILSQQVLQRILWPIVQGEEPLPETLGELFGQAVQMASRQVYDLRRERASDMGTTLTAALVYNGLAIIANVGDSRTYVWGSDGLLQLTRDHSLIADLIATGQEPPEAIYTHPQRNLINRSLGDNPQVEVDLFSLELEPGFRLILCCDGVWEMIRNEGIEEVMLKEEHPQRAAEKIVQWANDAGGDDNISVIVVNVEHV